MSPRAASRHAPLNVKPPCLQAESPGRASPRHLTGVDFARVATATRTCAGRGQRGTARAHTTRMRNPRGSDRVRHGRGRTDISRLACAETRPFTLGFAAIAAARCGTGTRRPARVKKLHENEFTATLIHSIADARAIATALTRAKCSAAPNSTPVARDYLGISRTPPGQLPHRCATAATDCSAESLHKRDHAANCGKLIPESIKHYLPATTAQAKFALISCPCVNRK